MKGIKRILLVTSAPPWPTNNGGRQRTFLLYQALSKIGVVDLICICYPEDFSEADMVVLRERFNLLAMVPESRVSMRFPWTLLERFSPKSVGRAAELFDFGRSLLKPTPKVLRALDGRYKPENYDLVVGRYLPSIAAVGLPVDVPVCLDVDDLDTDRLSGKLRNPDYTWLHRFIFKRQIGSITKRLPSFLKKFDHVWVCNPKNRSQFGLSKATVLPNIPLLEAAGEASQPLDFPAESREVGVIASFRYDVNEQGMNWFLERVWPSVVKSVPEANLKIYGSGISSVMRERWSEKPRVSVVGFVGEVEDAYRSSALMVCPVLAGGGTNIKVVEAAYFGRVCVLTEAATRGYREYPELKDILQFGESASAMSSVIVKLLLSADDNKALARSHRDVFQALFSLEKFEKNVRFGVEESLSAFEAVK
jgi:glycosyltransferase involved in cell wall biosynthesis